jgi:glycosyltransferase involved in cell wall biosynthesis
MKNKEGMKVSFLAHNPPYQGGIVQYSILLANSIQALVNLNVIGYKNLYPRFLYKGNIPRKSQSGIDFKAPLKRVLKWYSPLSWYLAYRHAKKSDIIHINWVTAFVGPVYWGILMFNRFGSKRKVVITCHNITDHEPIPFSSFFTQNVFGQADQLIVHAPENKERLHKDFGINPDNVTIVPHGDFSFFIDLRRKEPNPIETLRQSENEQLILFFGYIRKYKGLPYLIKAFPEILRQCPDTRLVIAGECWEDISEYERLINDSGVGGRVHFFSGFVPDREVWKYFDAADLVVLPYHNTEQTISGPLLVSMAFGKAAVAGNCGGIGNLVSNGEDGLLVEGGNVEQLKEATIRLLKDPELRENLGRNAKEEIKKFNWPDVAKEIVEVYKKALGI